MNGGTPSIESVKVDQGTPVSEPSVTLTRNNDTFMGWQLNGSDYNFSSAVNADITLKANWKAGPVATVTTGGTSTDYSDFAAAVSAWNSAESGATLKLRSDVTTASTVNVSGTKTLDLNGYGIKMLGASDSTVK